jgi:predicted nucleotidyltransferase
VAKAIADRRREQRELIELARTYVQSLAGRLPVAAASVVGSVARGDFNAWSDIDVVLIVDGLPPRAPERSALLLADAPPRIQPIGFTRDEFGRAFRRGNPLAREALELGVTLHGAEELRRLA